jgi:uncharacterized OsmC-like protein
MLTYHVAARRIDAHGSLITTKSATLTADTDLAGRQDAFNPAELLLGALAACILKGVERVAPLLHFTYQGAEVTLTGQRQDAPPLMQRIDYTLLIDTDEPDARLDLMLRNVQKYGTVHNSLTGSVQIVGCIHRAAKQPQAEGFPSE